jgi:hypothetical protein
MYLPGLDQYLNSLWQRWQIRGARPEAQSILQGQGWLLLLCLRAKVTAWILFLLFGGMLVGVLVMQVLAPQPQRVFLLLAIACAAFAALAVYYLVFVYWYRVILDEQGLTLHRFLLPPRRLDWRDISAFSFAKRDELLKLRGQDGRTIALYLSLNGLSAIRRCLAAFTPATAILTSWSEADPALLADVPSWRCDEMDLEDDPFAPLGTWETGAVEDET